MPAGHIIPPGSAQDFVQQQAQLRAAQDEQKLRQGTFASFAPIYVTANADQNGITYPPVDLTSLTATVVVGTRRLIRCISVVKYYTASVAYNSTAELYILQDGASIGFAALSGTQTGEYLTLVAIGIVAPTAGSHTYKCQAASNPVGTINAFTNAGVGGKQNYLLVEDIGQAPA